MPDYTKKLSSNCTEHVRIELYLCSLWSWESIFVGIIYLLCFTMVGLVCECSGGIYVVYCFVPLFYIKCWDMVSIDEVYNLPDLMIAFYIFLFYCVLCIFFILILFFFTLRSVSGCSSCIRFLLSLGFNF